MEVVTTSTPRDIYTILTIDHFLCYPPDTVPPTMATPRTRRSVQTIAGPQGCQRDHGPLWRIGKRLPSHTCNPRILNRIHLCTLALKRRLSNIIETYHVCHTLLLSRLHGHARIHTSTTQHIILSTEVEASQLSILMGEPEGVF